MNDASAAQVSTRSSRARVVLFAALPAMVLVMAAIVGWSLLNEGDEPPGVVFVIPAGSKFRVMPELESAVKIPTDIRFAAGETAAISIINEDDVTHRAGPFLVGGGQTYVQRFDAAGVYPITCSVDPAESIVVTVEA